MSLILIGQETGSETAMHLAEKLADVGFQVQTASSGYEVIQLSVELHPAMVLLEGGLTECDTLKTSIWLKSNLQTADVPQFLLVKPSDGQSRDLERMLVMAEKICGFAACFSTEKSIDEIASAIQKYAEKHALKTSVISGPLSAPTRASILADLVNTFEERFLKSHLMISLFQISRNLEEVDYFAKNLMAQVGTIFDCELVSFLWRTNTVTEYNLVSTPVSCEMFEALRRRNHQIAIKAGWGADSVKDVITWGRKLLTPDDIEIDDQTFGVHSVGVDIKFRNVIRGHLTLASPRAGEGYWDREMLSDFQDQLSLIFSNFIMYHDLEMKLSRDTRIFQSIGELAGISNLALEDFQSYVLQALLILLELSNTTCGAIIIPKSDNFEGGVFTIGAPQEFFMKLTTSEENVVEMALKAPEIHVFGEGVVGEPIAKMLDGSPVASMIVVPLLCDSTHVGVILLTNIQALYSMKEIEFLGIFAKQIANQVHNHTAYANEQYERESLEEQLAVARDIQMGLLPDGAMQHCGFDIYAKSNPAKEVGGDFFDYYPLDDELVGVAIADVSGKGMPAALLMSASMTTFRSIFENYHDPAEFMSRVNNVLAREFFSDKFLTGLFGLFGNGKLVVASGGHHPVMVYRKEEDKFEYFEPEGIAMGILEGMEFQDVEICYKTGDITVFFTDGLCEAKNTLNEQFGYTRIEDAVRANANADAKTIVDALFSALSEHTIGMPIFDDTTIIVAVTEQGAVEMKADRAKVECTIL